MAVSMSVVTQAIVFLSMACFGDFGPYRKRILVCAAMTAACCCCLFTAIKKNEHYFWAAYLLIFIEVSLGISLCMYNAYIPELARSSVEFKALMTEYKEKKGDFDPNKATKDKAAGKKVLSSTELLVRRYSLIQDQLSEIGHIWGYSGSSINVLISTVVVMATGFGGGNDKLIGGIKNAMFAMGIWWFIFTMPAVFVLRKRDGPPLPGGQTIFHYFWFSLKRSASTFVATVNYLPNTRNFMLAFFMYTDLISTISQCGILFALDEMGMTVIHFVWICIIAPCSGVFWMWFVRTNQRKRGWKTKTILLCALCRSTYSKRSGDCLASRASSVTCTPTSSSSSPSSTGAALQCTRARAGLPSANLSHQARLRNFSAFMRSLIREVAGLGPSSYRFCTKRREPPG